MSKQGSGAQEAASWTEKMMLFARDRLLSAARFRTRSYYRARTQHQTTMDRAFSFLRRFSSLSLVGNHRPAKPQREKWPNFLLRTH